MEHCTVIGLFESVEQLVRAHVADFIESIVEDELAQVIERTRYARQGSGYRNGHRERTLVTTFGQVQLQVPRARIFSEEGESEFHSSVLPKGKRLTPNAEALIVSVYLCGVSTRKSRVALSYALGSGVSKSTVSRALERLQPEWEAWKARDLSGETIERLILDGIVVPVRLGKQSFRLSILVALGVRADGQKVALSFTPMGAESKAAWQEVLEDLSSRGLSQPLVVVTDGSKGLEAALTEVWPKALVQRCTVHKERNLLAKAPEKLHEELKEDYRAMMYAETAEEALLARRAFLVKWKQTCPAVARSLEEAGDRLFTFLRFPPSQWKTLRTTNSIERFQEEFRRRIKVQGVQPSADSVCMLFWALLASGAVTMRKVDGHQTLATSPTKEVNLAA